MSKCHCEEGFARRGNLLEGLATPQTLGLLRLTPIRCAPARP